jgi:cyclophilin family peptidyl-prolyl cis-trans isomerase/HEAT repeat protein
MNKQLYFILLITAALFTQCLPPEDEIITEIHVDFTNPAIQKLYDFQDSRQADSLFRYFHHKDPTYRYLAALAFASIRDTLRVDSLAPLLYDPIDKVRIAAAYAMGQTGNSKVEQALIDAFDQYDTAGISKNFNAAILEATGKCGTKENLAPLASISTYHPNDTTLLEGQAWGIYRFALRNITSAEGTAKMMDFATHSKYPPAVRMIGANYLSRAKDLKLENGDSLIAPALAREGDPRTRMALAIALGKTQTGRAANALLYQFNLERDYRVRCNLLRALYNFDYEKVKPVALQALKDPNIAVATLAARFFVEKGLPEEGSLYWQLAKDPAPWEVQMALYTAASKHIPLTFPESRKYLNWELKRRLETATNPYEKAAALQALAANGWNYRYIRDVGYLFDAAPVRTASVEALAGIARRPDFDRFFGGRKRVKKELKEFFMEAIQTAGVGMTSVAANVLREPGLGFKDLVDSLSVLEQALPKLKTPQAVEAYIEVQKTLNYFKGVDSGVADLPASAHPIDWKLISNLKKDARVVIKTAKGDIILEMLPEYAPGSVANFLTLVSDKFFNGKNFHRVVPNFVIQGGCTRGDGYGSLDYTIRSEVPYLHYDREGCVGMASAGPDTEGTQFFITHSPTPHLDGRYTLFAKVVAGMDVVHKIQIGDVMEEVVIQEQKK